MTAEKMVKIIREICGNATSCDGCQLNMSMFGVCGLAVVNWDKILDITRKYAEEEEQQ